MGSAQPFEVRQERIGRVRRLIPTGELDLATVPVLEQVFAEADNIAGQYVTIHVGGPLDGIVTLIAPDPPRVVVEATWGGRHNRDRMSLTRPGEREALILADSWTNQLIDGFEPTRDLLRPPRQR